jgi:Winged helix-turn helix
MAEPVRARRLTDAEGQTLQRIVRRGKHDSIRVRRALIIMASASGTTVPAIAGLVQADEDTVRGVIHAFNQVGLHALDPRWAGGRPARSALTTSGSSSRRPPRARRSWAARSRTGASASSPTTWPAIRFASSRSGGSGCGSCWAATRSLFSAPAPGRSPPLPGLVLGAAEASRPAAGDLPAHRRHPLLPRLLRTRRRSAVGHHPPPQRR